MTLPITQVTVHPDGALITRAGPLALAEGEGTVLGLPLMLDPASVRVWLAGAEIAEVRTELDLEGLSPPESGALIESFVQARDELSVLDTSLAALRDKRRVLAALAPGAGPDPEAPLPTPEQLRAWRGADASITAAVAQVDDELAQLSRERQAAVEALAILEERVQGASTQQLWRSWAPTRLVRIRTREATTAPAEVSLSYRIGGASWTPSYTLDADAQLKTGRFSMRAVVVQATGEDWSGVALRLSSARSGRWIDVPQLAALRLGPARPAAGSGFRALPPDLDALFPAELDVVRTRTSASDKDTDRRAAEEASRWGRALDRRVEPDGVVTGEPAPEPEPEAATGFFAQAQTLVVQERSVQPQSPPLMQAPAAYDQPYLEEAMPRSRGGIGGLAASVVLAPVAGAAALASAAAETFRGDSAADDDLGWAEAKKRIQHRPEGGAGGRASGRRSEPAPGGAALEVGGGWLDYGSLRLESWGAAAGRRGRLRVVAELEWLSEQGAPPEACERFSARLGSLRDAFGAVAQRPLPPHHVLPGPIEGADVSIEAVGEVDVPSDGLPHSMAVEAWAAEIGVAYRAVPRHDPRAFRRVTATIDYPRPLLPGPVDVYVGGQLELTSPWAGSPGAGRLQIGLGAEDRLKLVRNVRYHEESAGVFGGSRRLHTTIEVEVASSLPDAAQIEILERIPVALQDKELSVEITEASPPAGVYEGEPDGPILKGGRAQRLELDAGGRATATLAYAVTLGARDELVGGDQRG